MPPDTNSFNVEISFKITKADGSPFAEHGHKFSGMGYAAIVDLQKMGVGFLDQLQKIGAAQVGDKSK